MEKIKKKVLIINSNSELIQILTELFEDEGYVVSSAQTVDLKSGKQSFNALLRQKNPDVVVYDIAIPYEENWKLFKKMLKTTEGKKHKYVLTTTNKAALEKLVGPTPTHLVVGKPFDLTEILKAIKQKTP